MKGPRIDEFMKAQGEAVEYLRRLPIGRATIVHHNDTDGITSGAILQEALRREGYGTEGIPIERAHPSFLPKIHTPERKLILYADLGSQAASMISPKVLPGTGVIILDHHPPFQVSFPNLIQVNPESFGIDGDLLASAASVAFFFARTLSGKNEDLAYLAVIGAIGDNQVAEGKVAGLNQMALEIALQRGSIQPSGHSLDPYRFPLFEGAGGSEVSREITDLAVNGYYRGGAARALAFCREGPAEESRRFAAEMRKIQRGRFGGELERIQSRGISSEGETQWIDVEDRFYPLGLKSIGIFCEEITKRRLGHDDKYLVGFQDFPTEVPILGKFEGEDTKVSMRVPPALRGEVEQGEKPNLVEMLPDAAREAGGFAEGCHRFSAACTIPRTRKRALLSALNRFVIDWLKEK